MSEKESHNKFKFSLYQENVLLCEKAFNADQFNPFTRYSINIRDILPRIINKLQRVLSKKSYDTIIDVGGGVQYDMYRYNQKMINGYDKKYRDGMYYMPDVIVQEFDDKTIRGVECKIGLYINGNPIVERVFYVDGYNTVARWSSDLLDSFVESADMIFNRIKQTDVKNMWDDYDLINTMGFTIDKIREMPLSRRDDLLSRIKRN